MSHTLIFANGELNDGLAVRRVLMEGVVDVIAADGGSRLARRLGLKIALVIGDMDSISDAMLRQLKREGCEVIRHPIQKDETDLELALLEAAKRGASSIRIVGGLGGRFDQELANIYLLNLPELDGINVQMVAGSQTIWVLSEGEHALMGRQGDTISLLPLGGDVVGITTQGLKYPLNDETLFFGPARGVSNVITDAAPRLTIHRGRLLVIHTVGRA